LTADGWLISAGDFDSQNSYLAYNSENKIFEIKKIIKDPLSKINFLKIQAKNLEVVNFINNKEEIIQGKQVILLDKQEKFYQDIIAQPSFLKIEKSEDLVRSTDYFSESVVLQKDYLGQKFSGSFIFGLDGLCLGLVGEKRIIPYWQFERAISQLLEKEEISWNYFGTDYLQAGDAFAADSRFENLEKGIIVYGNPDKNSPFFKAGLRNADVIVKVDGIALGKSINFTQLAQNKKPGEEIELTVLREGEEIDLKVIVKAISQDISATD